MANVLVELHIMQTSFTSLDPKSFSGLATRGPPGPPEDGSWRVE